MPLRFVLYARRSTDEQSASIESQLHELTRFAEQRGLDVIQTLTESRSAKAPGRPVFDALMRMLEQGEADAILCWHLNRLTRNEKDSGDLRWNLRTGVIREILTPTRTYRPEDNAYITAVETAGGEQFLIDLTDASRRGTRAKVRNGGVPFKAPPGYVNDRLKRTVETDPILFPLIRGAFQEMLSGQYSVAQMHRKLNREWGLKVSGGRKPLSRNTVLNLFDNVFYTGFFRYDGDLYAGRYEPMLTMAEYERLQLLIHRKDAPRPVKEAFTYASLARCGRCGHSVCGDRKRKVLASGEERFYTYYGCAEGSRGCSRASVRQEAIEARVAAELADLEMPKEFFDLARLGVKRWKAEQQDAHETARAQQGRTLADLERKIGDLLTLRLENLLDDEEYRTKKRELQEQRNAVLKGIEKTTKAVEQAWESVENAAYFLSYAPAAFTTGTPEMKGQIARLLAESYTLENGELKVEINALLRVVRANKEKIVAEINLLEPGEIGSESMEKGLLGPLIPTWLSTLTEVRILAMRLNTLFPRITPG